MNRQRLPETWEQSEADAFGVVRVARQMLLQEGILDARAADNCYAEQERRQQRYPRPEGQRAGDQERGAGRVARVEPSIVRPSMGRSFLIKRERWIWL
jgi:hypothetical protein